MNVAWFLLLTTTLCCIVVVVSAVAETDDEDQSHQKPVSGTRQTGCNKSIMERKRRATTRVRSSNGGGRYTARATRTFSTDEIAALNEGLHRKRPKFVGKRQAVEPTFGSREDEHESPEAPEVVAAMARLHQLADGCSDSKPDDESSSNDGGRPVRGDEQKRAAARKFLGRRSMIGNARPDVPDDYVPQVLVGGADFARRSSTGGSAGAPRRKFVGKRTRKFVGRRSQYDGTSTNQDDVESSSQSDDVIDDQMADDTLRSNAHNLLVEKLLADELLAGENDQTEKRAGRKYVG